MKCPICESTELRVEVRLAGQVACKFVEGDNFELVEKIVLDSNWDDHSCCECTDCLWVGTVQIARDGRDGRLKENSSFEKKASFLNPISNEELEDLKRLLETRSCHPLWRKDIERLISEVERLNAFLDTIFRVTNSNPETGIVSSEDTVIG